MTEADAGGGLQRVLLVDDEADIREPLKALLETCLDRVEATAVASADEALALLRDQSFDLVIADFKMPGMDGLAFLQATSRLSPETPRILVTAFPDLEIAIRAINEANVDNFFTKPFEPDQILGVVRALLSQRRAQRLRSRSLDRLGRRASGWQDAPASEPR